MNVGFCAVKKSPQLIRGPLGGRENTSMRLKNRSTWLGVIFLLGGLIVAYSAVEVLPPFIGIPLAVGWFALFIYLDRHLLVCPHCGRLAAEWPNGVGGPVKFEQCQYCGRDF